MTFLRTSRVRSARISAAADVPNSPAPPIWRPGLQAFVIAYLISVAIGTWAWLTTSSPGSLDIYLAVFWTLPILGSAIGMYGALRTWRRSRSGEREEDPECVTSHQLIVVIPTIGRLDTLPALERVLKSTRSCLPAYFSQFRIDVVIEADCEARSHIEALARTDPYTHVVVVPASFQTVHRTRFKARANHYANLVRLADGDVRDDVWVLHMDDDTDVRIDTAAELARFVTAQDNAGDQALDLCQGVLCYPRELANNRLVWLADAIRPGCDLSIFAATTGRGRPYAGLHGELLMVRASVEGAIGWDFGPRTIVEDAQFALHFCARYPGRSGWIPARSYGASPATASDFVKQRERWVWGLLELVTGRSQRYSSVFDVEGYPTNPSRRQGLLMLHNTVVWACAPLGHPVTVLLLCLIMGSFQTSAPFLALVPFWAFNAAYGVWLYWEGLKLNALSSALPQRLWWEPICLLALAPVFTLWEVAGIVRGIWRFFTSRRPQFTVIPKLT